MQEQKALSVSKNSIYNMSGSIVYCICQWVISSLLVYRLSPNTSQAENVGVLQLAISITNIFNAVGLYSVRTYQISDIKDKFLYGDYIGTRIITSALSLVSCIVYASSFGYSVRTVLCICFYMFYKLTEIICDVLHGIDQKNYRMDYVFTSFVVRGVLSMTAFAVALLITKDILMAIIAMAISSAAVVALYDCNRTARFGSIKPVFNKSKIKSLLLACFPAVLTTVAFTAITSIPRQILENIKGTETLGFYAIVAAPMVIVQVMATSVFNPMLTQLAEFYYCGKVKKIAKILVKNLMLLACISGLVCICIVLFGEFAVGIAFGEECVPYTYLMYGIIGCTSMYVVSWLCTNVLIVIRKIKVCMTSGLIALIVSIVLAKPMIKWFDINGVSYCIIVAYAIHITICAIIIYRLLKNKQNEQNEQNF